MSYESEKFRNFPPHVMDSIPYRLSAKAVAITQLTLLGLLFMLLLIVTAYVAVGPASETDSGALAGLPKHERKFFEASPLLFLVIILVCLFLPIGFTSCLLVATSKTSRRPINSRLALVYCYVGWTCLDILVTTGRVFHLFSSSNSDENAVATVTPIATVLVVLFELFCLGVAWKFMIALKNAHKSQSNVEMMVSPPPHF